MPTETAEEARKLWLWCFVRVQNLWTEREPPYLTAADAMSDPPAVAQIREAMNRVRAEALEDAAKVADRIALTSRRAGAEIMQDSEGSDAAARESELYDAEAHAAARVARAIRGLQEHICEKGMNGLGETDFEKDGGAF